MNTVVSEEKAIGVVAIAGLLGIGVYEGVKLWRTHQAQSELSIVGTPTFTPSQVSAGGQVTLKLRIKNNGTSPLTVGVSGLVQRQGVQAHFWTSGTRLADTSHGITVNGQPFTSSMLRQVGLGVASQQVAAGGTATFVMVSSPFSSTAPTGQYDAALSIGTVSGGSFTAGYAATVAGAVTLA